MSTLQNKTINNYLATIGVTGYSGISAAANGSVASTLDITCTNAWAILPDGTIFEGTDLVNTSITGLTVDGSYQLYLDWTFTTGAYKPVFVVAASAPSFNARKIADVTVSGGVISAVTMTVTGLAGYNFSLSTTTAAPPAGSGDDLPATPAGYATITINGTPRQIAFY